jgi:hypothetical protein
MPWSGALAWLAVVAAMPGGVAMQDGASGPPCCILVLPPTDRLLETPEVSGAPAPERPAPDPRHAADIPAELRENPAQPPMHPRAQGGGRLCPAPPDTGWAIWYKEGMAYADHSRPEPLTGRRPTLPFSCY